MHFCSKFGNFNFNWWWVMACTSSKWGKFWLWSSIWPSWRSRSIAPQNNRDLNQGLLHLLSKFGDPSLNRCWVIARTSKCLPHGRTDGRTDGHTDRQTQATTIPEGQNWPRVKTQVINQPSHLFSEHKEWWWEMDLSAVTVDWGLVYQCSLVFHGEDLPLGLMEAYVGVEAKAQQGDDLEYGQTSKI